jgi:glycosyltransferase involved in cell wall biosynthesis
VLSLCLIVRNEEAVLARCLASVAGVADEIVLVDTGSTDATVTIAREHGATVLGHDFDPVDFGAARNAGLAAAAGDFILVLDADETLDPASAPAVRLLASEQANAGYVVTRRNIAPAKTWFDHAVRLFPRRPEYRYRYRVHETVDDSILAAGGRILRSEIVIDHHLPGEAQSREKGLRYLALLEEEDSRDPDRLVFLAAEYHKLERYADAVAVAERVATLSPDDFTAQLNAGLYHLFFARDPDRAKADVQKALDLRPTDPEALALLARIDAVA